MRYDFQVRSVISVPLHLYNNDFFNNDTIMIYIYSFFSASKADFNKTTLIKIYWENANVTWEIDIINHCFLLFKMCPKIFLGH